ncbi:hypothetical protein HG533_04240 [Moraxella osloensis]|nr:hypothetical protein [Moraxella osloensis]
MISSYRLRGQRVEAMTPDEVKFSAREAIDVLNIKRSTLKNMDVFIENLPNLLPKFNVDIIYNDEWLGFANALFDPKTFTIAIPNSLYVKMVKQNDSQAIFIFFHELGHALLGHVPVLHHIGSEVTEYEDAEWQADCFAEEILNILGDYRYKQLQLDLF